MRTPSASALPSSPPIPRDGRRWASTAASACWAAMRSSASSTTSIACTETCSTRTPPSGARVEQITLDLSPRKREERVPARLLLACDRLEAGLPAPDVRLVLHEEPEHHVDARVLASDRVGLLHIESLLRP